MKKNIVTEMIKRQAMITAFVVKGGVKLAPVISDVISLLVELDYAVTNIDVDDETEDRDLLECVSATFTPTGDVDDQSEVIVCVRYGDEYQTADRVMGFILTDEMTVLFQQKRNKLEVRRIIHVDNLTKNRTFWTEYKRRIEESMVDIVHVYRIARGLSLEDVIAALQSGGASITDYSHITDYNAEDHLRSLIEPGDGISFTLDGSIKVDVLYYKCDILIIVDRGCRIFLGMEDRFPHLRTTKWRTLAAERVCDLLAKTFENPVEITDTDDELLRIP